MSTSPARTVLLLLLLAGCDGEQEIMILDESNSLRRDALFGFKAELDKTAERPLGLMNTGLAGAELVKVIQRSGSPVRFLPFLDPVEAVFIIDPFFDPHFASTERKTTRVVYDPPTVVSEVIDEARVEFQFRTASGPDRVLATLLGRAMNFECGGAVRFDFMGVMVGDSLTVQQPFSNTRDVPDTTGVWLTPDPSFKLDAQTPGGPIVLAPHSSRVANLLFAPEQTGHVRVLAQVQFSELCPLQTLTLEGNGVDRVLTGWSNGFAPTVQGTRAMGAVTLRNLSSRAVNMTPEAPGGDFEVDPTPVLVPAATRGPQQLDPTPGTTEVPIFFTPSRSGTSSAMMRVTTDLPAQPALLISLEGQGVP